MCIYVCFYVEPISRSKDYVQSLIKIGSVICLYAPVLQSVPEMEGIYATGGILYPGDTLGGVHVPYIYSHARRSYRRRFRSLLLSPLSVEPHYFPLFADYMYTESSLCEGLMDTSPPTPFGCLLSPNSEERVTFRTFDLQCLFFFFPCTETNVPYMEYKPCTQCNWQTIPSHTCSSFGVIIFSETSTLHMNAQTVAYCNANEAGGFLKTCQNGCEKLPLSPASSISTQLLTTMYHRCDPGSGNVKTVTYNGAQLFRASMLWGRILTACPTTTLTGILVVSSRREYTKTNYRRTCFRQTSS